jgi:hypothetical protein
MNGAVKPAPIEMHMLVAPTSARLQSNASESGFRNTPSVKNGTPPNPTPTPSEDARRTRQPRANSETATPVPLSSTGGAMRAEAASSCFIGSTMKASGSV